MADAPASTPGSTVTSKTPAPKDRECQYCHQAFTSSSLGRHLDLYIKSKNAKPPDDLHDVEEIRRLRGNVTRRQARTSSGKRESSTSSSSKPTPLRDQRSPSVTGAFPSNHPQHPDGGPVRSFLNKPNWQSTGVINNLDPTIYHRIQSPSRRASIKAEIEHKQHMMEERDRARAAELALNEVLESVKFANSQADNPLPFDFNFLALSFPELCLECLEPPQALLSGPSISKGTSWSLEPPKTAQYEGLRTCIATRMKEWQRQRQRLSTLRHQNQQNGTNGISASPTSIDEFHQIDESYKRHLSSAYESWKALPDRKKQETWSSECAKAYARKGERYQEIKRTLENSEQEIRHLRFQITQLKKNPSYALAVGPNALRLSPETTNYLPTESGTWEYEALLRKWKGRIKASRDMQYELPPPWSSDNPSDLSNSLRNDACLPDQPQSHLNGDGVPQNDADEDLADALGEEDDMHLDDGVLDPTLSHHNVVGGRARIGQNSSEYDDPGIGDEDKDLR